MIAQTEKIAAVMECVSPQIHVVVTTPVGLETAVKFLSVMEVVVETVNALPQIIVLAIMDTLALSAK
jgi:hypothetical protein